MSNTRQIDIQLAAEATIIGAVLFRRDALSDLGSLTPAHFVDKAHAIAWLHLLGDRNTSDQLALQLAVPDLTDDHIKRILDFSKYGQPTVIKARDRLADNRRRREIRRLATEALAAIDDPNAQLDQIVLNLSRAGNLVDGAQSAARTAQSVAQRLHNRGNSAPITTGIASLDYVLHGGLHLGSLTGILARYKHGKSLMQATLAHNLEQQGVPTLLATLERREGDIERFIAARCLNVDKQDLDFENPHNASFWEDYCATARSLHYLHRPGITIEELRAQILAAYFAFGVRVVLIDYWQLIRLPNGKESREERQALSAQILADLASELDIAIVITGQLNQDGHPHGGEGLLASAGIVIRIQRPEDQEHVFFDTLVSNQGPARTKGNPKDPAASITLPGPHFADYREAA